MEKYYSTFVRTRIASLRNEKHMTEKELSLALGKGHSYIHDMFKRRSLPTFVDFFRVCESLGVTPYQFFDEESSDVRDKEIEIEPTVEERIVIELKRLFGESGLESCLRILEKIKPSAVRGFVDFANSISAEGVKLFSGVGKTATRGTKKRTVQRRSKASAPRADITEGGEKADT